MTRIDSILTKNKLDFSIKLEEIIMIVVAFFLSRVSILSGLTPFGLVYSLIYQEIYLYGLMMIAFESLLIFTMTYLFSFSLSIENMGYGQLKNEKIICSFITFALVISGATNIIVFDIGLKNLICIFLVIYLSYTKGLHIGSTVGIVLGMITFISSSQGDISGDNFTFGRVDNTNYMALSDGMGIGEEANFESKAAIEILERMIELGGTRDMTLLVTKIWKDR